MKPTIFFPFKTKQMCYLHTSPHTVNPPHQLYLFISMTSTQKTVTHTRYSSADTHNNQSSESYSSGLEFTDSVYVTPPI